MVSRKQFTIAAFVAILLVYFYILKHDVKYLMFLGQIVRREEIMAMSDQVSYQDRGSRILKNESRIQDTGIRDPDWGISQNNDTVGKMVVAVVACGDRWKESLVLLKSTLLFTKGHLQFIIFAEDGLINLFKITLQQWKTNSNKNFDFVVRLVKFPAGEFESSWRKLFKPCAAQRLFFPSLLPDVDSLLYLDTDTLVLGQVEQIWHHFSLMNSSHLAALAPEHEEPQTGWYNRFARHPFYKPLGVNTGVMLMNLTRMRKFEWERYLLPIYKEYKLKIPWGDQDIINIIFHYHPDKLYIYSCKYNYRADHCMYSSVCKVAEKEGIVVLHGSRGIFHTEKFPPFRTVYNVVRRYQWYGDIYMDFYLNLKHHLNATSASNCGKLLDAFMRNVRQYVEMELDGRT